MTTKELSAEAIRHPYLRGIPGLTAIGYSKRGKPIFPVMGASEGSTEGNSSEGDGTSGDDDEGNGASGSTSDSGPEGSGSEDKSDKDPRVKELSDEAAKYRRERNEANTKNADLAARLKAIEDKDKSETERATAAEKEASEKLEKANTDLYNARLQNAFLTSNKYTWHNPARALTLVDLSGVEIDDDGKVTGLDKALDALAKSDAYLIKADDESTGNNGNGSTGAPVGSGGKGNKGVDKDALLKKYPALRGRG